jgi:hypothetical protein
VTLHIVNMNNVLKVLYLFLTVVATSCKVSHYIPPAVSTPLFKESGESVIQAFAGSNHLELQGAHAISNHLGAMTDVWVGFDGRYSFELAPGYYHAFKNNFCVEGYAGFGFASASAVTEVSRKNALSGITYTTKYVVTAPYQFLFFQPAIGYRVKNFEFAFIPRISYVKYADFNYDRYEKDNDYQRQYVQKNHVHRDALDFWSFQPTIMFRGGFKKIKAFASLSLNMINVRHEWEVASDQLYPEYQGALLAIGFHLRLGNNHDERKKGEQVR